MRQDKIFKGTIARVAISCTYPDTGEIGCFLYTGDTHRDTNNIVSPVFGDLWDLYNYLRDGKLWTPYNGAYIRA